MTSPEDSIRALEEALQHSPDNVPLRRHLADTLYGLGRFSEAIKHFKQLVRQEPRSATWRVRLADCFLQNKQISEAAVVIEKVVQSRNASGRSHMLAARIAMAEGETSSAVFHYKTAIDLDPDLEDEALSERLGIGAAFEEEEVFEGRIRQTAEPAAAAFGSSVERPRVKFADVGGMEDLKEEIRMKIIYPIQNPEIYKAYGKTVGGGIMMYGPPGCGKTHLARATAGEIDATFINVGINDVLDMWMGNSERNLHQLFQVARQNSPCVLFFDEVDALGGRRSDMNGGSARQLINQFLAELDGATHSNEGVLILAATNAPWHVDSAFRRPGRFDRVIFVPPPDAPSRDQILQVLCQNKPTKDIDFSFLAKKTDQFSGADMKAVVDLAVESKLSESLKTGRPVPITGKDLLAAAQRHKPTTKEWFATAKNYALYSNEGGLYDDILTYLKLR
ncbi:AAA family ATPase [Bremerella cremea]|uniref:AAA family ATPase n=1 Tax=Bremerella cremea TaxID=1031537 RepID=A0A368KPA9_9BACT|nr:ATP-binding protein [Bremerella cremea]RCS46372.1 AAA family ATPase [Bremerella cremea]